MFVPVNRGLNLDRERKKEPVDSGTVLMEKGSGVYGGCGIDGEEGNGYWKGAFVQELCGRVLVPSLLSTPVPSPTPPHIYDTPGSTTTA